MSIDFKWFRDNQNIYHSILVDQTMEPKFCYSISQYISDQDGFEWIDIVSSSDLYRTYEEAEIACLNAIYENRFGSVNN